MGAEERLLEFMTWQEIREAAKSNLPVVLPVGSTEQHGPHLPIATDVILPVGVSQAAAKKTPLVIAPPIRYGARSRALSGGGETFPGTLSLRAATLVSTVKEVLTALGRSGFRHIVVQCWHYENKGHLWEACDLACEERPELKIVLIEDPMPRFDEGTLKRIFPNGFPGWDVEHASILETSLMYAIRPDLVRTDLIADDEARRHPEWDVIPAPDDFVPKSGVLWHPTEASPEIGRLLLEAASSKIARAIHTEFGPA